MPVPTSAPARAPSALSLTAAVDDVASYVRMLTDDETRAQAARSINNGIRDLNKRHWYWSLTFQDITTVVNVADYQLADDYDGFRSLQLYDSNSNPNGSLAYLDPGTFCDMYNVSTQQGNPCHCTVDSPESTRLLTLNVLPISSWQVSHPTMRVRYFRLQQLLVEPADIMEGVPPSAQLYVLWYAKAECASIYMPDQYGIAKAEKEQLWQALVRKDTSYHYLS